ncbi:uncharacterized protein LOC131266446 [Anopheles coustani]|uniref:uncharacterized protein LOC131266446 n=1 Tax=Anopheles coustani TaxID=139045 RepID=UPI00265A814A|nr:uncharacterized protein LOC131266446 [Anopheles coustani]
MNTKCRLCLCSVGKHAQFTASLHDDGFCEMLKIVFRFPLPTKQIISGKNFNLPVTVCPQCSTSVRNFYSFTRLTEANQKKLQTECPVTAGVSFDELLLQAKTEPDDIVVNHDDVPPLLMWNISSKNQSDHESNLITRNTSKENSSHSFSSANQVSRECSVENPSYGCVDEEEVTESILGVERRINMISTKMDKLLNSIASRSNKHSPRSSSFKFTALNSEGELTSFEDRLQQKEYKENVLGWLDANINAVNSGKRMSKALDLLFSRKFFAQCSWTGRSHKSYGFKVEIGNRTNVLELFRLIGSTNICSINERLLKRFFIQKTKNSKPRIHLKPRP